MDRGAWWATAQVVTGLDMTEPVHVELSSNVQLFATPWTVARQAPLPMAFSRQEYWSGWPCPPPGIFQTQGSNPCLLCLLHWQAGSLPLAPPGTHHCNHSCVLALKNSKAESRSVVSDSLLPHGLYSPYNSPGQNTGVDSLSLLQGIFPTLGSNLDLPHCKWILYQLSHQGSPRILEWVAYPFSSRSSQPRNPTGVSCITGRFFTN